MSTTLSVIGPALVQAIPVMGIWGFILLFNLLGRK